MILFQKMVDTKMIPIESENDDLQKTTARTRELEAKMKAPSVSSSESTLDALTSAIPQIYRKKRLLQVNVKLKNVQSWKVETLTVKI